MVNDEGSNPYEAPRSRSSSRGSRRSRHSRECLVAAVAWSYPVVLVASFYLTWVLAWWSLGRRPIPLLDDPKQISAVVDIAIILVSALVVFSPAGLGLGIAATAYYGAKRRLSISWQVIAVLLLLSLWVAAFYFLRKDPWQVVYWFMD